MKKKQPKEKREIERFQESNAARRSYKVKRNNYLSEYTLVTTSPEELGAKLANRFMKRIEENVSRIK